MEQLKIWWAKVVAWFKGVEYQAEQKWDRVEQKADEKYHDWKAGHKDDKLEAALDRVDAKFHESHGTTTQITPVMDRQVEPKAVEPHATSHDPVVDTSPTVDAKEVYSQLNDQPADLVAEPVVEKPKKTATKKKVVKKRKA